MFELYQLMIIQKFAAVKNGLEKKPLTGININHKQHYKDKTNN